MAQQSLAWKELRVGILVVASFVLLALAIFFIGGDSGFFTPKYSVTVFFGSAGGLHAGAAVLLDGVTIGNVSSVRLSPESKPNQAVQAVLRLDKKYHDYIRSNAAVSIGTVGLLGDQQVELTRGTTDKPPVEEGGSIQGTEAGDIKKIITGTNDILANLDTMTNKVGEVLDKVNNGEGALGKFLNDPSVYNQLSSTIAEGSSLIRDARTGPGTIGRLMSDDDLYRSVKSSIDRLDGTITKVDNIVAKVDHGDGTIGKFMNDPALYNNANELIAKFGPIADRINNGEGTLGKLSKDEKLYDNINSTLNRTNALLSSVENGEGSLGKLMKDPSLYNSLTQTSSEIQKLMYDFRQNPKKYLTINFRLF